MQIIDWRICSDCTDFCNYCFASEKFPSISLEQEKIIIDKIIHSNIRVVNISGGEPMIDTERCFRIMDILRQHGKKVYLSTNGYQVSSHLLRIKNTVSLLGLPLDGPDEVSNMVCGRSRESFRRIESILKDPIAEKIKIKIGTVITRKNLSYQTLKGLAEFMDCNPVNIWRIYEMLPENRAIQNRRNLELTPEELNELTQITQKIAKKEHHWHLELVTRQMRNANYMIIRPDGSVIIPIDMGIRVDEVVLGNLIDLSFQELIQKWKVIAEKRTNILYARQRFSDI